MRVGHVFLISLLLSLVSHGVYWRHLDDAIDQDNWIREMKAFHETSLSDQRGSLYYGYPATTILGSASFLARIGIPPAQAFPGIMVMGISLPIALSAMLCYLLRPKSLWWVGALGLMVTSQLYYGSTPPSAIVSAYSTLLILYALYIYEKKKDDIRTSILFGSIAGISLATRLDISLIVLFFLCLFLLPVIKRNVVTVLCAAFVVFVLCDPYMQVFPIQHVQDIFHKIIYHTSLERSSTIPFSQILLTVPLSTMGLVASILLILFPRVVPPSVPRRFLVFIVFACVSVSISLVVFSTYRPAWYFYPLLQIFEVLFVLYLLDALVLIRRIWAIWPVLALLIIGNAFVFFRKLFL
jgi:hypothetical protein